MKSILVTGGAGFIGGNFIKYIFDKYDDYNIVNLDKLTYAADENKLKFHGNNDKYTFIKGDICDRTLVKEIFEEHDITHVVNFAAESHVDRSIEAPNIFLETNVIGTQVLLDTAYLYWLEDKENRHFKRFKPNRKFVQISTDEVYGSLGANGAFTENSPIQPNSPYSASKASADLLVRSYYETYGLPMNITRCSNNYGPHQHPEKLIPLMILKCLRGEALPVYGDGLQVRDWLHVYDHCTAIDAVLHKGISGQVYNIGGNEEKKNIEIVELILEETGSSHDLIEHVKDRLGHDRRYAIDNSKITSELGWKPSFNFDQGMTQTIDWYKKNTKWLKKMAKK